MVNVPVLENFGFKKQKYIQVLFQKSVVCFLLLFLISLAYSCFTPILLVSAAQQSELSISIRISPLFFRFPSQVTKQSSLCCTVGSHQLFILYIVIYTCQSQFPVHHTPPSPLLFKHLFSVSVSLFVLCKQVHLHHFSRFHIYPLFVFNRQEFPAVQMQIISPVLSFIPSFFSSDKTQCLVPRMQAFMRLWPGPLMKFQLGPHLYCFSAKHFAAPSS